MNGGLDAKLDYNQDATGARQVLRALLVNRLTMDPVVQDGRRRYRYAGTFTIGQLFEGFLVSKNVGVPDGNRTGVGC